MMSNRCAGGSRAFAWASKKSSRPRHLEAERLVKMKSNGHVDMDDLSSNNKNKNNGNCNSNNHHNSFTDGGWDSVSLEMMQKPFGLFVLSQTGHAVMNYDNVQKGLVNPPPPLPPPPSTMEGEWIIFFNWLWRDSLCAIDSLLLNVLGTMFWILYWQMYWGFGIGSLDAFAFFSSPFTSFHFLSFPDYCFFQKLWKWKELEWIGNGWELISHPGPKLYLLSLY